MQSTACLAMVSLLISVPAVHGEKSVCKLNGKAIVFSGERILRLPKGISGRVEAKEIKATLLGMEAVTINGMEFRAYGQKLEVDGRPFPVSMGETLLISEKGISVLPANSARDRGSVYVLNGKNFMLHGYQTVTFPEGMESEFHASGMRATLTGDVEVRLNKTRIRIRGDQVEIDGRNRPIGIHVGDLKSGFTVLAEDELLPSDDGKVVCTLNGKEIVIFGRRTLTIPEGMYGTIEAERMYATLTGKEVVTISGRQFTTYGNKLEVDGMPYPVADSEVLEITPKGIMVRPDFRDDPSKSVYRLNGKRIALAGKQKLEIPKGVSGKIEATVVTATLTGEEEVLVDGARFATDGDLILMNGKKIPVLDGDRLEFTDEGYKVISPVVKSKNRGKMKDY
ncbi:MAG: hypothetical protein O7H41_21485 [Planctomycetota bacterium]|nr:hypothetical protein [Planctomycetota bacterium]